tara:strand:- start:1536 stop:1931 length:396 start_codon:yes stop_codon:yes gene_type:complete
VLTKHYIHSLIAFFWAIYVYLIVAATGFKITIQATLIIMLWSHCSIWISLIWAFAISSRQKKLSAGFYGFVITNNIFLLDIHLSFFSVSGKPGSGQAGLVFVFLPLYAIFFGAIGYLFAKIAQVVCRKTKK